MTPLLVRAILRRDLKRVRSLVQRGADVNLADEHGWLPLHRAAASDHPGVVGYLLRSGSALEARGTDGWTPLHLACVSGSARAVAVLINGKANVNAVSTRGDTPLHLAMVPLLDSSFGKLHDRSIRVARTIATLLMGAGAEPAMTDSRNRTPASIALKKGATELARTLERK